ncbi:hypothetical protein [Desulforhopalus singaporensis]|uniref:hypothetical protein n=1 Tax=Desulforhopalus singaporensis TaxID=91360 RepID=UPI00115FA7A0|nr:hypothetical protein [Desulforhopalus singaporensis]
MIATWLYDTRPASPEPVLLRTVVNRAYYAALITARDYTGSSTVGNRGHGNVVDALRSVSSHASNSLDAMRLLRRQADYELGTAITEREACRSITYARQILYDLGVQLSLGKEYSFDFLDTDKFVGEVED